MGSPYPNGKEVPLPIGRRWVISDIHGCLNTLHSLLDQIDLKQEDQLFLLGDYVNKGPSSLGVLEQIINSDQHVFPIIGNHDKKLLDYYTHPTQEKKNELIQLNAESLVEMDAGVANKLIDFISNLPYYYVSGDFILVHAGFNFLCDDVFLDVDAMINIREFAYETDKVFGKRIIHGHYPKSLSEIETAINQEKSVIPLDNGCIYRGKMKGVGNLIALELNEMKMLIQANIDQT